MTILPKILIVDDEPDILSSLRRYLTPRGYRVMTADTGSMALAISRESQPDLVVTDVDMPDMDGFTLCRLLKKERLFGDIPVIIISGKAIDESSVVSGLDQGADDYMVKPLSLPVLVARIRSALRRTGGRSTPETKYRKLGIELDISRHTVLVDKKRVDLTRKEFDLLAVLISSNGRVLSPQFLLEEVWGYDLTLYNNPHTVEVHVSRLRKKLGAKHGRRICKITGTGYKFE